MSEIGEAIAEVVEEAGESRLGTIVALLVALAATFVALASVKDRNLTLGMTRAQTKAVDAWNQYQAKSMKQNLAEATLDELLAMQEVSGGAAAAAQLAKRIETYHGQVGADEEALAAQRCRSFHRPGPPLRGGGIPELEYSRRCAGFLAGVVPMSLLHSPEAYSPRQHQIFVRRTA